MGQGPKTGRGAGYCSGADEGGYASAPGRRGFFGGFGGGRMRRRGGSGGGRGFGAGRGRGGGWGRRAVDFEEAPSGTGSLMDRLLDRLASIEKRLAGLERND
jgi:hypothetical protein